MQDTSLGYVIPYDGLLHRSQDVSSYAPQSLLQAAFIVTMMYGVISAVLLYLKRWIRGGYGGDDLAGQFARVIDAATVARLQAASFTISCKNRQTELMATASPLHSHRPRIN